jgi:hypothetical protein
MAFKKKIHILVTKCQYRVFPWKFHKDQEMRTYIMHSPNMINVNTLCDDVQVEFISAKFFILFIFICRYIYIYILVNSFRAKEE